MLKLSLSAFAATFLLCLAVDPVLAQSPDPNTVYVTSIAYEGSGCRPGSVGQSISSNRQTFTLIFDQFIAATGAGVPSDTAKRDCEVKFLLNVPASLRGAEIDFTYRGYIQLTPGMTASHKRKYSSSKTSATTAMVGNVSRDYTYDDPVAFTKVKSCDGTPCLIAKVKIGLRKSDTPALLTIDSIEGNVSISN